MATNKSITVEELTTCTICRESFKDPRLLPCSHTYCRQCIERMASENKDQFECPLRDGFVTMKKNIRSLPLNKAIRDLVELHASIEELNRCTNCRMVKAKYACNKCENENFCSSCYETVHTPPVMQKHQRLSKDEKPPEAIPCIIHPKKSLEYWCLICSKLICIDCLLFQHKDHNYILLDDVIQGFKTKININLQSIQSSLHYKINQADILLNIIDNNSKSSRQKMIETMAEIRRIIDEHEKDMLQNILNTEKEQKKRIEDYKIPLTNELQRLNMQKIFFEMFSSIKNHTKLLEAKEGFDDYVNETNEKLKLLPMPTITEYFLEGIHKFPSLKEKILQCGRYVEVLRYHNPQLEEFITDNRTNPELDLKLRHLVFGGPAKKYGLGKDLSSEEGSNSDEVTTSPNEIAVGRSFTCNSMTGDFLCAGWPGAWRCQCGSACYNNVCTCNRCI
ncbi:unnamed protein product [Rotaria sp. Silwood1]|nr:unnamed protein product [Rotaria sp. Silwood1]